VGGGDWIVFFSEPYEMTAGRTEEIYRDIIPGLADLAKRTGKTLVVKLHPSENLRDRQILADKVLTREQSRVIQWLTGRFAPELLKRTWFGITVQSSVVMECVVHGVPCFVCEWLDLWPYGYIAQYSKFGVGLSLGSPDEIARIPDVLAGWRPSGKVAEDCWQSLKPERFEEILAGRRVAMAAPLRTQQSQ
jgi:hypothetical protein